MYVYSKKVAEAEQIKKKSIKRQMSRRQSPVETLFSNCWCNVVTARLY